MQRRARKYHVRVSEPDESETVVEVYAETPNQAVGMAVAVCPVASTAISAIMFLEFVGKCMKCRAPIERQHKYKTLRGGLMCSDCTPGAHQ